MRAPQHSIALVAVALAIASALSATACRRAAPPPPTPTAPRTAAEALLDDVVDPWTWPRAAHDCRKAIEDIGPYERARPRDATAPLVNTNGHYWTALAGIAWDRDVDIDFDGEPVDLDGDGLPDTTVTRHVHAKGGVLANPELFGLTRTPDDPRGSVGCISASTGVLGLREALDADGKPTGEIGMTCWACHGAANPTDGRIVLGFPGVAFDYGLFLATAAVLDDGNAKAAAYRHDHGYPPGRTVRARLLLAGPGRQDLTGEFGLDITVPGYHSARYAGTARVRQGTRGLVNPISVPGIRAAPGLALENWSGSEDADAPWLANLVARRAGDERQVVETLDLVLGIPRDVGEDPWSLDRGLSRRALLFDLRNLGTLGLQQDSFPGLLWADALTGRAELSWSSMAAIPRMYAATSVRKALKSSPEHPGGDPARIVRGREIFEERFVGAIVNRQILKRAPQPYAAAKLEGPVLAPIDPTKALGAKLDVRCADCHAGTPLDKQVILAAADPPLGRCSHCHVAHSRLDEWKAISARSVDPAILPVAALPTGRSPGAEVAFCEACHTKHRAFGPLVYSSGRLFPFDANGDGDAQLDPAADRRAGGIGTDPWLAFDVPRGQWPFAIDVPSISDPARAGHVGQARIGASWVRAAPLVGLAASAPYLHNGSVPTLRALLEPPDRRPKTFPLGRAGFVFDTRLAGNHNQGHVFGTTLTPAEKDDLVAFLESL
jgi:hypothetical protein